MKQLSALVTLPIALFVILFALANREWVVLSLDPFNRAAPAIAVTLPLWGVAFGGLLVGILIGGLASWTLRTQKTWRARAIARAEKRSERAAAKSPLARLPTITPAARSEETAP